MAPSIRTLALSGNAVIDSLIIADAFADKQITYSFGYGDLNGNGIPDFDEGDWKPFYREILDGIESFADLRFLEATGRGTINFVLREGGGGESLYPYHGVDTFDTVVGIHPDVQASAAIVRLGTYSHVWLHEIGHALGLAHPHDDEGNGVLPGVTHPGSAGAGFLNSHIYTVMGYTHPFLGEDNPFTTGVDFGTSLWAQPGSFGAIDIAALQYFYGARASRTGSDIYRFSDDVDFNRGYTTIWDTGGVDTIQYVGSGRAKIDLRAATLNPEIGGGGWISTSDRLTGGYTIAHGVTIENATGAAGDDILVGNHVANILTGGAGRDLLTGGAGNDVLAGTIADLNGDRITDFAAGDVIRVLSPAGTEARIQSISVSGDRLTVAADASAATLVIDGLSAFGARLAFRNGTVTIASAPPPPPPEPPLPPEPPVKPEPPTADPTHIHGTSGNDRIAGTSGRDIVDLTRGTDRIDGKGGVDAIFTDLDRASLTITRGSDGEIVVRFAGGSTSVSDVELLRTADGLFLLGSPAPQGFDAEFYLAFNLDVAKAFAAGTIASARAHYDTFGLAEGRIGAMPFDESFYLRENPDVARAVLAGDFASGRDHFDQFGKAEGRDPIPLFDTEFYLRQNPDVGSAVEAGGLSAYEHFLRFGSQEGRAASQFFDGDDYLAVNPDVALAGIDPIGHLYSYGVAEGRELGSSLS